MLEGKKSLSDPFGTSKQKLVMSKSAHHNELVSLINEFHEGLAEGTRGMLKAARAIKRIKDTGMYLDMASTFEEFCVQVCGKSKSTIYRRLEQLAMAENQVTLGELNVANVGDSASGINDLQQIEAKSEPLSMSKKEEFKRSTKMMTGTDLERQKAPDAADHERHAWLSEMLERVTKNSVNAGFRSALSQWMDESGL